MSTPDPIINALRDIQRLCMEADAAQANGDEATARANMDTVLKRLKAYEAMPGNKTQQIRDALGEVA